MKSSHTLLFIVVLIAVVSVSAGTALTYHTYWEQRRTTLTVSQEADRNDQRDFANLKALYQKTVANVLTTSDVTLCSALPELFLPYYRNSRNQITYSFRQNDGLAVPDRLFYWPRTQCIYAYANVQGTSVCEHAFANADQQSRCIEQTTHAPSERFATLEEYPQNTSVLIGKQTYVSPSSGKEKYYFITYPDGTAQGILIYLHGAGGDMEQGMLDRDYKDSFKKLRALLEHKLQFIYVAPSFTDFGAKGAQDVNELASVLHQQYPTLPLYLAGSSAGGRVLFYTLQDKRNLFSGALAMCPAVDETLSTSDWKDAKHIPIWIVQGDVDPLVPHQVVDRFVTTLKDARFDPIYRVVHGDHGTPIEVAPWEEALKAFGNTTP